jgi:multidrug efflux pump subunit AcrB
VNFPAWIGLADEKGFPHQGYIDCPARVVRYDLYPAADVNGSTRPGFSCGQSLDTMEKIVRQMLPAGMAFKWTDIAYQERLAGNVALYIFPHGPFPNTLWPGTGSPKR